MRAAEETARSASLRAAPFRMRSGFSPTLLGYLARQLRRALPEPFLDPTHQLDQLRPHVVQQVARRHLECRRAAVDRHRRQTVAGAEADGDAVHVGLPFAERAAHAELLIHRERLVDALLQRRPGDVIQLLELIEQIGALGVAAHCEICATDRRRSPSGRRMPTSMLSDSTALPLHTSMHTMLSR